jgi:inositol transport system substrate-binding protein
MTKAIVKAGKPLVYVNRKPENLPKGVVYVGSKSIVAGVMNMEELGKALGGKGKLAILIGELSDEPAHGRTDGIKQVVKKQFPKIKVTREQTGHWKREPGKTIMEDWLASGEQIDGVAANNDEMALGALQAIKAAGKIGKIPVGGTDGTHDALESMGKGELNNTVFQDPVAQGEEAVNAASTTVLCLFDQLSVRIGSSHDDHCIHRGMLDRLPAISHCQLPPRSSRGHAQLFLSSDQPLRRL